MDDQSTTDTVTEKVAFDPELHEYPEGVTEHSSRYGDKFTMLDAPESGYPEFAYEFDEDAEADEDTGLKPITKVLTLIRTYGGETKKAIRTSPNMFVRLVQSFLTQYMHMAGRGNFGAYGNTVYYALAAPWAGKGGDTISAAYVSRRERRLRVGGLSLTFNASQWEDMKRAVAAVEEPMQRVAKGAVMEVRFDYSISHTVEVEVDDVFDYDHEEYEDAEGNEYWLVSGTEDEVNDLLYEAATEVDTDALPSYWHDWDYSEPDNTEIEGTPEITEHEVEEDSDGE